LADIKAPRAARPYQAGVLANDPPVTNERVIERFTQPPSAPRFMARAFRRSAGLREGETVPRIAMHWSGLRFVPEQLRAFSESTGLRTDDGVPVLLPQVMGFRLQMALLTHPAYPLPIWTALQVRNRLVRHARIEPGEPLDLHTGVAAERVVEKGIEVDLLSRLTRGSLCCWDGRTTIFYRGRFGRADAADADTAAPDLSASTQVDRFRMPDGGGWAFGKLTGDYNGIHSSDWYARRFGFSRAFLHPQRVAAMCLARLPAVQAETQSLDLWIKGPVFYGAQVRLNASLGQGAAAFGVALEGDPRYALSGHWRPGVTGSAL
jgi:hypothetical protein